MSILETFFPVTGGRTIVLAMYMSSPKAMHNNYYVARHVIFEPLATRVNSYNVLEYIALRISFILGLRTFSIKAF
jgi:hypothetical protein